MRLLNKTEAVEPWKSLDYEKLCNRAFKHAKIRKFIRNCFELVFATAAVAFITLWVATCVVHDKVPTNSRYDTMPINYGDEK
jgi:hypothetical protein